MPPVATGLWSGAGMDFAYDAPANLGCTKRMCLFTFKQIVPWSIEQDDLINYEGALKMELF